MEEEKFSKLQELYDKLERKVIQLQNSGESIVPYVKKQIEIVEYLYREYLKDAASKNITRSFIKHSSNELWYNFRLKLLSEKIGESTEKYQKVINEICEECDIDINDFTT